MNNADQLALNATFAFNISYAFSQEFLGISGMIEEALGSYLYVMVNFGLPH